MQPVVHSETLLATLAQSGATMVAIIAGLLVARMVPLVGERDNWRRRINELRDQQEARSSELQGAEKQYLDYDGHRFMSKIENKVVRQPDLSFDELYELYGTGGRAIEELRPYFDELKAKVIQLRQDVELVLDGGFSAEHCESAKAYFPDEDAYLVARVIGVIARENKKREAAQKIISTYIGEEFDVSVFRGVNTATEAAYEQIRAQRRTELRRRIDEVSGELRDTELALDHAHQALKLVQRPGGLRLAFGSLAVVTTFGAILPLLAMAIVKSELSQGARAWFVGVFIASILVFITHLALEARRLVRGFGREDTGVQ